MSANEDSTRQQVLAKIQPLADQKLMQILQEKERKFPSIVYEVAQEEMMRRFNKKMTAPPASEPAAPPPPSLPPIIPEPAPTALPVSSKPAVVNTTPAVSAILIIANPVEDCGRSRHGKPSLAHVFS